MTLPTSAHWPADRRQDILDTTVGELLRDAARQRPDGIALVDGAAQGPRARWTWAELLEKAERLAGGLLDRFRPGERIALCAPNVPEWVFFQYGAALAGLTLVTVNPGLRAPELIHALRIAQATGLCFAERQAGEPFGRMLAQARADLPDLRHVLPLEHWESWGAAAPPPADALPLVAADDIAMIIFTSGTTGRPKGAMLRHVGVTNNYRFNALRLGMTGDDVFISQIPLFHVGGGGMSMLTALAAQATLVLGARVSAGLLLDLVAAERATTLIGVPTMFIDMLAQLEQSRHDVESLRLVMIGGAVASPDLIRTIERRLGASVRNSYGQTESGSIICATEGGDTPETVSETVGRPFPGAEVRIARPDGETAELGEPGELCLRGYQVMAGYVGDPAGTAATIDTEQWLHTGDVCSMDGAGRVRVVGRLKEMIIRGGENLFPKEIEEAIGRHPGVLDVAVIGVPDPRLGETVAAFVRLVPGAVPSADMLETFVSERLSREKVPVHWRFVEAFAMTASGKVSKPDLLCQFLDVAAEDA